MIIAHFPLSLDEQILIANSKHPAFKRLILLDGFVFSRSQFTHALQQYSSARDKIIEILCHQGIFLKKDVFAKKTSNDSIDYLEGFVKFAPSISDSGSGIEQLVEFGKVLAQYDITIEEYIQSFVSQDRLISNPDGSFVKYVLTRSDIKLKSFLFSVNFVEFLHRNQFYSQRFAISTDAICIADPPITPTTSNTRMLISFLTYMIT